VEGHWTEKGGGEVHRGVLIGSFCLDIQKGEGF